MPFSYLFQELWRWFADTGINILLLILLALLVPRAGRFANRSLASRVRETADAEEGKSQLAISGVVVYICQLIAYFLIFIFLLQQLGFSLAGAAIPATVVSAAIGFGAQNIIADFLAGFFILTEKQYGVGDYVTFQGNGLDVSGDVIQITMRATTIRTINQGTVTIPNSAARIYINESNYWVNALVVMAVPLAGSESAGEAVERSERATRRAIARPEIHEKILGDLIVHPAVGVNPPSAAGLPWTVNMRFMIRVEPLSQWMVERAIRVAILDEFWDEYGAAGLVPLDDAARPAPSSTFAVERDAYPPTERMEPVTAVFDETSAKAAAAADPAADDAEGAGENTVDPADDSADAADGGSTKTAFNGLMRVSTAWLIAGFILALILRGLMLAPDDAPNSGVLAPPKRTTVATSTAPSTTAGAPATARDATENSSSQAPSGTSEPAPATESSTTTSAPSDSPTEDTEASATATTTTVTTGETTDSMSSEEPR